MADRFSMTDPISQLPNMGMAHLELEKTLRHTEKSGGQFAILLFCFDNLRQYNEISLGTGEEAIRLMVSLFKAQLRETDFLARWRTQDEFMLILPSTSKAEALKIGTCISVSVAQASLNWKFGLYISGSFALYPDHGCTVHELIDSAEASLRKGKRR